jgi:hypothetical protein
MVYEIEQKLRKITDAWDSFIIPYQFCRDKINFEEQKLTNYIVGISGYFHDTFEIIFEPQKYNGFAEMFSYYISYLQAIYIQQDLVIELLGLFKIENTKKGLNADKNYSLNRNIRNELVGHPISRSLDKNKKLESSTVFGYWPEKDSITYLRYHRDNNFNGEIISYNISEIRNRHILFLDYYFDKIIGKINEIISPHLVILNELTTKLEIYDFYEIVTEVSKHFESFFSCRNEFEKEKIIEIHNRKGEHIRYRNMIDYFLYRLNYSLLEAKNLATSFIEKREYIPINQNDLVFKYNDIRNDEFHYELGKLSESNHSMRGFSFNTKIIRDRFPQNFEINEELNNMTNNPNNIIEYYCSLSLLNRLINEKTNNCP